MKTCALYAYNSIQDEVAIDRQLSQLTEKLASQCEQLVTYREVGHKYLPIAERPQIKQLLKAIETSGISVIAVTSLNRLSRSVKDIEEFIVTELSPKGVTLLALDEDFDSIRDLETLALPKMIQAIAQN